MTKLTKPETVGLSSERLKNIGESMRSLIDSKKIPGTVTLVARKGEVVHFEANGKRDIERDLPMEIDTIHRIYSQSKPITGAALMMLFEEGKFLMTDPVAKYLPEFSDMQVCVGEENGKMKTEAATSPITIQQLASHTSGLSYSFMPGPVGAMYIAEEAERGLGNIPSAGGMLFPEGTKPPFSNLRDWTKALAELPLVAQPGTVWNYSVGMDVMGALIEELAGMTFGEFLQDRIFGPLGMEDTGFMVPEEKLNRFAANYSPVPDNMMLTDDPEKSGYRTPSQLESGGGGLVSTVGDYLKFAQMLLNKGEYEGKRYLGKKTVKFMTANHMGSVNANEGLTSLFNMLGNGYQVQGMGFGVTGSVVVNPALTGLPVSKGAFSWGGAASTHFWIDNKEDLIGIVHTQLLPDGTYPVRELMQLATYQAIID
ncbi:MAG: class A beta-lactamase-related serine hydrolase [Gammaproteobacteria bacterium]|nr:MAG: class A beta-lactamase-related serine hydrolase [Gammaproteobacteria bacterium]